MARVQFVETVVLPLGPGGSLVPVPGIATTPVTINPDQSEGPQASAYAARTGSTIAASLITDSTGTVRYWLDSGDYNIHFDDQETPVRVAGWVQGFNAAIIDQNAVVIASQNLIQFTGDLKFSMQAGDHGVLPSGAFEWVLITGGTDGLGRKISGALYAGLRVVLGTPALDTSGNFRLPNISGRSLVVSGSGSGLTARTVNQSGGAESTALTDPAMNAPHNHTNNGSGTGIAIVGAYTGITGTGGSGANVTLVTNNGTPNPILFNHGQDGNQGTYAFSGTNIACDAAQTVIADGGHAHGIADGGHTHGVTDAGHNHSMNNSGTGTPHPNMQPYMVENIFIKT